MNTIIKSFIAAVVLLVMAGTANAQVRIAHIASDSLVLLMPERDSAIKILEAQQKRLADELDKLQLEYQKLVDDYQKTMADPNATTVIKEVKAKKAQDMASTIERAESTAQQELATKQQQLLTPIVDKIKKAIEEVAKERGYTYVLDSSSGIVLYSTPADDLMPHVKKKLGLK